MTADAQVTKPRNLVKYSWWRYSDAKIRVVAMRDGCWRRSTPAQWVKAFNDFMDTAESRGSDYGDRAGMLATVAAQKPGPLPDYRTVRSARP